MNVDKKDVDLCFKLYVQKPTTQQTQLPSSSLNSIDDLKRSADNGNIESMYEYGNLLYYGERIPVNKEEASHYYQRAADKGHSGSMFQYAYILSNGDGIPTSKRKAIL